MTQAQNQIIEISPEDKNITKTARTVKKDHAKYWGREEINKRLNQMTNYKEVMLCRFLWMSGVRITEALSLQKKDIDFTNYMMKVKWLKSRKYNSRTVPLHPTLRNILAVYVAPINLEDRIFPITRQRAWTIVKKNFNGSPHQFRHSFAVNWLMSGGEIITLHNILGHSKVQTTMEYLKIVPVDQGKELLKINFE